MFYSGVFCNLESVRIKHKIDAYDTETLLATLYDRVGDDIPNHLDGTYVVVIVDTNRILMFRDSFGCENAFYYRRDEDGVFIVTNSISILKTFLTLEVDKEVLCKYFVHPELIDGHTLVKNVFTVRSNELVSFDTKSKLVKTSLYNDFAYRPVVESQMNDLEIMNKIEDIIRLKIVQVLNTFPDCQKAGSLSGGVDSSYIQSVLGSLGIRKAFCATYSLWRDDEKRAKQVSKFLEIDLTVVRTNAADIINSIREGIELCEMPFIFEGEYLLSSMYAASADNLQKKHSGIILFDGQGAEGVFGYGRILLELQFLSFPGLLRVFEVFNNLLLKRLFSSQYRRYRVVIDGIKSGKLDSTFIMALFRKLDIVGLVEHAFQIKTLSSMFKYEAKLAHRYDGTIIDKFRRMLLFDIETPRVLNARYNQAKSRGALLVFPFTDANLIRFLIGVNSRRLMKRGTSKYYLKRIANRYLPKRIVYGKKKGHATDYEVLFNHKVFKTIIEQIKDAEYSYFNFNLDTIFKDLKYVELAFRLINFHIWHDLFISNDKESYHFTPA